MSGLQVNTLEILVTNGGVLISKVKMDNLVGLCPDELAWNMAEISRQTDKKVFSSIDSMMKFKVAQKESEAMAGADIEYGWKQNCKLYGEKLPEYMRNIGKS